MRIGGFITYISNRNDTITNAKLKSTGITYSEAKVIHYLYHQDNVSQDQLTKFLSIDKSAVTRILKNMVEKELIQKTISHHDKRSYDLILLEKGRNLFKSIDSVFDEVSSLMVKDLSEEEKELLLHLLDRVKQNMENKS